MPKNAEILLIRNGHQSFRSLFALLCSAAQKQAMASVYVHLSGRDVDKALLKLHGIQTDEQSEEKDILAPKKCIRCSTSNPASNKFCSLCGLPLDQQAATGLIKDSLARKEADGILDKMLEDPQFRQTFLDKARELIQS